MKIVLSKLPFLILFPVLVHVTRLLCFARPYTLKFGGYGTIDFSQYWSALNIWLAGENPYDAEHMLLTQRSIGSNLEHPILMWNPPWLLVILRLLIYGNFESGAYIWLLTSITLCSASVLMLAGHYKANTKTTFLMLISSSIFLPIHTSLIFGQLGAILLFGATLYFLGILKKVALLEGLGLFILSTKPHLLYLLILARFLLLTKERDFLRIAVTLLPSVLIIGAFYIYSPSTLSEWVRALISPSVSNAGGVEDWIVASFTGFVRNVSFIIFGNSIPWVMSLIPALGMIAITFLVYTGRIPNEPERYFPTLLTASLFFNPYGWVSDSTCLLLIPLLLIAQARPNETILTTLYLVAVQLIILPFAALLADQQHWLFWYPLAIYFLWSFMVGRRKKLCE